MNSISFLPSEISRLIYGYLRTDCSEDIADKFLNTCESMKECRAHSNVNFTSNFQDQFSLIQILNQYSLLSELILKNLRGDTKCTHLNIVPSLRKLLHSRLNHLAEVYCTRETRQGSAENKISSETAIKTHEKTVIDVAEPSERDEGKCDKSYAPMNNVQIDDTVRSPCKPSLKKLLPVRRCLVWDHSVQNILASYSPQVVDRCTIVRDENMTPLKKRKFEDTEQEQEVSGTPGDLSTRAKRRKTTPSKNVTERSLTNL